MVILRVEGTAAASSSCSGVTAAFSPHTRATAQTTPPQGARTGALANPSGHVQVPAGIPQENHRSLVKGGPQLWVQGPARAGV